MKTTSPEAQRTLKDLQARIGTWSVANQLWTRFNMAERHQLGGDLESAFQTMGVPGMWIKLHNCSPARAIIEIGFELESFGPKMREHLLQAIDEEPVETIDSLELKAKSATLLLVDRPRKLFWHGELVEAGWDRRTALWEYVEVLVSAGKRSAAIENHDLKPDHRSDVLKDRKSKIASMEGVPPSFIEAINVEEGTHRLTTPAAEIQIFDWRVDDEYVARRT